jgi:membrane protein implicated in regulation of membrane protease activity
MNPWIWAVGSIFVAIAELHCPGCYLIWIGIAGGITALASFVFDLPLTTQLTIFVCCCAVSCISGNLVYRRLLSRSTGEDVLNQRNLSTVGKKGVVADALLNGHGKVKLGDTVWLAEGPNLAVGTPIVVTSVRGTVVIVSPL